MSHGSKHKRIRRTMRRPTTCANCGIGLTTHDKNLPTHAELDHIVPVALGGRDERSNYQWLCRTCNRRKGAKMPMREPVTSQEW